MSISLLELRHIIESGFLPLECRCTSSSANELTIEIVDPTTGANLVVGGIDVATLRSGRATSELVGELRRDFGALPLHRTSYSTKTA
ncbi:hypothetical protein PMM47T1_27464 [Pseudomonas sp. M47T1]|uniref:DUF1652 domain-containing protein n=1 Tax=Pseudomonas sp. M47T1 TaxID=1179778 RepID=UPI0002608404|nr:DUF1652 domain-containing protein [Pseudomonas sp. M47T1]EIK93330.1 hypothetical protein PMM47T1_27464 [Pseudomonas sp. M47T1]